MRLSDILDLFGFLDRWIEFAAVALLAVITILVAIWDDGEP